MDEEDERTLCQSKWESGLYQINPMSGESVDDIVRVRVQHVCTVKLNDKYVLVRTTGMRKQEFLDQVEIHRERPADAGYYTWLVYSSAVDHIQFACVKLYSVLELGTVHSAIARRMGATAIHAAGEMQVFPDGSLVFNLLSGTFMKPVFESTGRKRARCSLDMLETIVVENVTRLLGDRVRFTSRPIFMDEKLPVQQAELDLYTRFGATVQFFDSDDECKKAIAGGNRRRRVTIRKKMK